MISGIKMYKKKREGRRNGFALCVGGRDQLRPKSGRPGFEAEQRMSWVMPSDGYFVRKASTPASA